LLLYWSVKPLRQDFPLLRLNKNKIIKIFQKMKFRELDVKVRIKWSIGFWRKCIIAGF
jgi:hypothetical protein